MDVVVNEMLFRNYHFDDTFATRMNLATLDSAVKMFKLSPKDVSKLKNSLDFETVLDVLSKSQKERSSEKTNFFKLDIHGEELNDNETNSQQQIDMQNFFKTLNSSRNIDTSEDLKNISKFLSPFKGEHNCVYRSLDVRNIKFTTNKKWENIIFDVLHKMIGRDCIENEKWLPSRRNNYIYEMTGLDLPSMHEEEAYIEINKKRKICFFMDVSESCSEHTRRFMAAVRSINQNLFDVSFFVFNIRCFKVKIDEKYIPWGGGTEFVCIEKQINEEFKEYPDAVFVITDGDGGEIKPRFPERWHWFLTEHPKIDVLPTESKKYQLKDFEG